MESVRGRWMGEVERYARGKGVLVVGKHADGGGGGVRVVYPVDEGVGSEMLCRKGLRVARAVGEEGRGVWKGVWKGGKEGGLVGCVGYLECDGRERGELDEVLELIGWVGFWSLGLFVLIFGLDC